MWVTMDAAHPEHGDRFIVRVEHGRLLAGFDRVDTDVVCYVAVPGQTPYWQGTRRYTVGDARLTGCICERRLLQQ